MQVHEACTRSSLRTVCNLAAPSYPADIWPLFARMLACNPAERCTLAEAASAFDALFGCNHGPELARLRADVTRLSIDNSKLSEQAARTAEETSRLITGVCCPPPLISFSMISPRRWLQIMQGYPDKWRNCPLNCQPKPASWCVSCAFFVLEQSSINFHVFYVQSDALSRIECLETQLADVGADGPQEQKRARVATLADVCTVCSYANSERSS